MSLAIPLAVTAIAVLGLAANRSAEPGPSPSPSPNPDPNPGPLPPLPRPDPPPAPDPLPPLPDAPTPALLLAYANDVIRRVRAGQYIEPAKLEEVAQKVLIINPGLAATLYLLADEMRKREQPIDIGANGLKLPAALGARIAFLLSPSFAGKTVEQFDAAIAELKRLGGFAPLQTALLAAKAKLPK